MLFGLFKRKDPICGMKEKGKGIEKHGHWFCSENCADKFEKAAKTMEKQTRKGGCCCH